jgi:hypothetical protein
MLIKNSIQSIGNRTYVIPAGSAMPQLTAPPHTGEKNNYFFAKIYLFNFANIAKFCYVTLIVMIAMFNTASCMLVPTAYS